MSATIVPEFTKQELDQAFNSFINEYELRLGTVLPEAGKTLLRLAFNEGWITATKKLTPLLKEALRLAESGR